METAFIAVLVSAAVSLIGVLASLRVVRQQQEGSRAQVALAAVVKTDEQAVKVLREYVAEVERLRIEAWHVLAVVDHSRKSRTPDDPDALLSALEAFDGESRGFLRAWADARSEVPPASLDVIRMMRHQLRYQIDDVMTTAAHLMAQRRNRRREPHARDLESIQRTLNALLSGLDQLAGFLTSLKNDRVNQLLLAAKANERLERPGSTPAAQP